MKPIAEICFRVGARKYSRAFFLLLFMIFMDGKLDAQVSGISGAKLCVPEATVLSAGKFEFEPSFSVFSAANKFCENGELESLAGKNIESDVVFRVTAGIADRLEVGTSFSSTISQVMVGSKYILSSTDDFKFGLIAGFSLPAGNKFVPDSVSLFDDSITSSFGSVASFRVSEYSSVDMIFSFTKIHSANKYDKILSYGIGAGYFISEKFQFVMEAAGYSNFNGKLHSAKFYFLPGFTYQISGTMLFVFGTQIDIVGKNENKGFGYFSAFTLAFN